MYLEKVSNKSEQEILKMRYPKFREYISFYTNAKEYLKPRISKDQQLNELDRVKMLKRQLEG